ncbi:RDD family protein [Skermania sp. ID1734]|uniref:RDD family protein n=1 Tax=Skermania sp. ID1734 TaxID=2597516 RepID=UPI00117DCE20|nr:RDD family protein [Skermania sp. ID1734]TSE01158.1 RDD family protein [Skermania sp. ID1734]
MARITGSWLSGPSAALPQPDDKYPGELLGLPENGRGSLASTGRRLIALALDWFMALGIALLIGATDVMSGHGSFVPLLVWGIVGAVSVALFSFTPGQYFTGVQVASVAGPARVGIGRSLARVVLITLVIPVFFTDHDGRGMQDRATGTAVVRSR